jgi:hypothetical protein
MQPLIIDDFISKKDQTILYELLHHKNCLWRFSPYSTRVDMRENLYTVDFPVHDSPQMNHHFYYDDEPAGPFVRFLTPLFDAFEKTMDVKLSGKHRIKANLLMPQPETHNTQLPHIDDLRDGRLTLLYYVMDSDGDTILYNEYFRGEPVGKLSVQQTVTPKQGRAVIFDSNQLHSAACPITNKYRLVINSIFYW